MRFRRTFKSGSRLFSWGTTPMIDRIARAVWPEQAKRLSTTYCKVDLVNRALFTVDPGEGLSLDYQLGRRGGRVLLTNTFVCHRTLSCMCALGLGRSLLPVCQKLILTLIGERMFQ